MSKPLNFFMLQSTGVIADLLRPFEGLPDTDQTKQDAEAAIKAWFDRKMAEGQPVIAFINARVSHAVVTFRGGEMKVSWRTQPVVDIEVQTIGGRIYLGMYQEYALHVNTVTKRVVAISGPERLVGTAEVAAEDKDSPLYKAYCRACALGIFIGDEEF